MLSNIERRLKDAEKYGLYDPSFEHDSCGVGFVVDMKGRPSHKIIKWALEICENMDHRGARGADPLSGDGSGLFMQIPHKFFLKKTIELGFDLPEMGQYGVGFLFLSPELSVAEKEVGVIESIFSEFDIDILGWRDVPVDSSLLGKESSASEPVMKQVFVSRPDDLSDQDYERVLYIIRRYSSLKIKEGFKDNEDIFFYFSSLSAKTITYKGMLATDQLGPYFLDFLDTDMESSLALTHSRFSTNTFPSWHRAQPFRYIAHNGEINTLRGNVNWMKARQMLFKSKKFEKYFDKIIPVIQEGGSDSQNFDNCLEFLYLSGMSLPHAIMMMIPEPWEKHNSMSQDKIDFYQYHACMMEPWDGPASIAFSDGDAIGAILDRNGLRPSRYYVTEDDLVIMASEVGVIPEIDPLKVIKKGRLEPGRMFLVDTKEGRIINDEEIKQDISTQEPYGKWLKNNLVLEEDLPNIEHTEEIDFSVIGDFHKAFGYSYEDFRFIIAPSSEKGMQPLGSMGNDTPLAVFSHKPVLLFNYFKQLFAQVSNPAIDPIREEIITSSITFIGSEGDLTNRCEKNCRLIRLESPIIDNEKLSSICGYDSKDIKSQNISLLFDLYEGDSSGFSNEEDLIAKKNIFGKNLENNLERLFNDVDGAIENGVNLIVLSDRGVSKEKAAIPSLLAVAGLHHHLIRTGKRTKASIILESAEPREVHHFALLLGYGCDVINPYLALDTISFLKSEGEIDCELNLAKKNFLKANLKGVIKTMAKIGISTVASYRGAQIFEAVGLSSKFIGKYFTNTASRIEGVGVDEIAIELLKRHKSAFSLEGKVEKEVDTGGFYQWRKGGERHLFSPMAIHKLQHSARFNDRNIYREYSKEINDQSRETFTLRGLMDFNFDKCNAIPLEEVDSVEDIVKKFKTGAMSYGSISKEAHETLAIAMNRLGGKSNTGEGGEDPVRFTLDDNGDLRRSAIKQVASGRFGVTAYYLANSDEIQIKIVQGAKPGEGGELPGHKVFPEIAKIRGTTPGVGLISPPPHHDIYSIEDLAELIHDLKNSNPNARVNVKLVSSVGVGTIASGVAKGKADVILISGFDGGTGASPLSSIYHAGSPWELGLAEANQTLLLNNLRSRVRLEVDGQLKTGRDVAIACLLGAEEFGFATAPLVTIGCLMMRVCHKNTCPVGIATQDKRLRKNFNGKADYVVNFLTFIAEELREIMAKLGIRSINEMVGRTDLLNMSKSVSYYKSLGLDYSRILYSPELDDSVGRYFSKKQNHHIDESLDKVSILEKCKPAIENGDKVVVDMGILNVNRVVGTILGYEISKKYGSEGLPNDTITLNFKGSAGQSLGAFLPRGITITVEGDTNDYCGKGMGNGKIIVYPPKGSKFDPSQNTIVGNVSFYGATGGEAYISGIAGERFCVRNSGVKVVVEGLGDHGCEYMTGGIVVCLGGTGRNFGAGMSGGIAYILDEAGDLVDKKLNHEMVNVFKMTDLPDNEIIDVKNMIQDHVKYTNSKKGQFVLDNFDSLQDKFLKIFPSDYQRVLEAQEKAREDGLKGDEAIQFAFEENVKTGH